jgi:hypothetical protein
VSLAEREGFYYRHFQQVVMIPTVSDSSLCLCVWLANCYFAHNSLEFTVLLAQLVECVPDS